MGYEDVDWINLAQVRILQRILFSTAMSLPVL